jgi:hypothetical protein
MKNDKLFKAYSGTEISVHILKDKLKQNGIQATIQNDSGDSFMKGNPIAVDLYIREGDIKNAEPIIQEFIKKNLF